MEIIGYKNYMDTLALEYPDVDRKSLEHLIRHGFGMMAIFIHNNVDVFVNNNHDNFYAYIGTVKKNALERQIYSNRVLPKKLRLVYRLMKTKYSGYRYMMLDEETNDIYKSGKPIERVRLFLIPGEARLYYPGIYLYRVPYVEQKSYLVIENNYLPIGAELIETRKRKKYEANSL